MNYDSKFELVIVQEITMDQTKKFSNINPYTLHAGILELLEDHHPKCVFTGTIGVRTHQSDNPTIAMVEVAYSIIDVNYMAQFKRTLKPNNITIAKLDAQKTALEQARDEEELQKAINNRIPVKTQVAFCSVFEDKVYDYEDVEISRVDCDKAGRIVRYDVANKPEILVTHIKEGNGWSKLTTPYTRILRNNLITRK